MTGLYPHLLALLLLSFFFAVPAEYNNSTYLSCPSYNCNGVIISYPFWRMDGEPPAQFCGYAGFGINFTTILGECFPRITLGGDSYYVQWINYEYKNIILADSDVFSNSQYPDYYVYYPYWVENISYNLPFNYSVYNLPFNYSIPVDPIPEACPSLRHGINVETLPLNISPLNVNLSFHFNCTRCPLFATEIPCLHNNNTKSCVHTVNSIADESDWEEYSCADVVVTPVIGELTSSFPNISSGFGYVMSRGFNLEWWRKDDCEKCENSNGRCGHSTTGFICFCSDGTIKNVDCKGAHSFIRTVKLVIGVGVMLISFVVIFIIYCVLKPVSSNFVASLKHKTEEDKKIEAFVVQYGSLSTKRYKYSDIKKMTNSFKVKLGEGGFGQVFKGMISDGRLVAVKVLSASKSNGQEFINEVASIGRTSHVNIVTLLGFCFDNQERALVYEYMPNGSLEKFIHSHVPVETSEKIGLQKLYEIALGIACGLDYLHRGCNTRILHLDIKPHNILLDVDFCPKIADFGLAKLYSRKESAVSMLEARGTLGYIAPEVYNRNFGRVSHKSDVYSYGMLLLEMVGGQISFDVGVGPGRTSMLYFPDWIYKRLRTQEFILDSIMTTEENDYARKMAIVGLQCIQPDPNQRPSINEVMEMLNGSMETLEFPPKPIFSSPP